MARTRRFAAKREHFAVTARKTRAYISAFAAPEQRARYERDFPESSLPPLPQTRGPRVEHDDLEKHVLAAVGELLAAHPQVLLAVRQNSGSLPYDRNGRPVPIFFYKLLRHPADMTIVDFWGFMRDGKPFALEAKRPSWRAPSSPHEKKQQAYLQMIEQLGGIAGFVRGADEAQALLA